MRVGIDLVEIDRFKNSLKNERFLYRVFTNKEIEDCCCRLVSLAGNFAVKEAFVKAIGTGFRGFRFKDITVERNKEGAPILVLYGRARQQTLNYKFSVSISHTRKTAVGIVIAVEK